MMNLAPWCAVALAQLAGCGGSARAGASARATAGASRPAVIPKPAERASFGDRNGEQAASSETPQQPASAGDLPPPPVVDPQLLREVVERTAQDPVDGRARLGLRLALLEQGPAEPWLLAVVNRGTQALRVAFDVRLLSLEILPPEPPSETAPGAPVSRLRVPRKPPKPLVCSLPKDVRPSAVSENTELVLQPGDGAVELFDPRLYCFPKGATSPLVPGATVTARLGWDEKTKALWKGGKKLQVVLEQAPPFVARTVVPLAPLGEPGPESRPGPAVLAAGAANAEAPAELAFERNAVKQLVATSLELGPEYAPKLGDATPREPLGLVLAHGSDARTEREATVSVALVNHGAERARVYFRRELTSFEISGPTGFFTCNPGPDNRAPDALGFSTLAPGKRVSATSRLVELCPQGSFRMPGLYLVHARYDARPAVIARGGSEAFSGRLTSKSPALVRIRSGWGAHSASPVPIRVRVGGGAR